MWDLKDTIFEGWVKLNDKDLYLAITKYDIVFTHRSVEKRPDPVPDIENLINTERAGISSRALASAKRLILNVNSVDGILNYAMVFVDDLKRLKTLPADSALRFSFDYDRKELYLSGIELLGDMYNLVPKESNRRFALKLFPDLKLDEQDGTNSFVVSTRFFHNFYKISSKYKYDIIYIGRPYTVLEDDPLAEAYKNMTFLHSVTDDIFYIRMNMIEL